MSCYTAAMNCWLNYMHACIYNIYYILEKMLYIRCGMHIIPNMLGVLACMSKQLYMHMNVSMYASYIHVCMHAWVIRT